MAYRVLADHIRALSVVIADGCYPGSHGREFVSQTNTSSSC